MGAHLADCWDGLVDLVGVIGFELFYEGGDVIGCDVYQDVLVTVVLHYLQNEDLVERQWLLIKEYQAPKEIQQFGPVETRLRQTINNLTDPTGQTMHLPLIIEHILIIIVHLPEKVDHTDIVRQEGLHRLDMREHLQFVVLVVRDDVCQEDEAEVQELRGDFLFGYFAAVTDVLEHEEVDLGGFYDFLVEFVIGLSLVGEVDEPLAAEQLIDSTTHQRLNIPNPTNGLLTLHQLRQHKQILHNPTVRLTLRLLKYIMIAIGLARRREPMRILIQQRKELLPSLQRVIRQLIIAIRLDNADIVEVVDVFAALVVDALHDVEGVGHEFGVAVLGELQEDGVYAGFWEGVWGEGLGCWEEGEGGGFGGLEGLGRLLGVGLLGLGLGFGFGFGLGLEFLGVGSGFGFFDGLFQCFIILLGQLNHLLIKEHLQIGQLLQLLNPRLHETLLSGRRLPLPSLHHLLKLAQLRRLLLGLGPILQLLKHLTNHLNPDIQLEVQNGLDDPGRHQLAVDDEEVLVRGFLHVLLDLLVGLLEGLWVRLLLGAHQAGADFYGPGVVGEDVQGVF